jgi:hypothetical protein
MFQQVVSLCVKEAIETLISKEGLRTLDKAEWHPIQMELAGK